MGKMQEVKALPLISLMGCFFLFSGLFIFPSNSSYKTSLYLFLFIPGIIAIISDSEYRSKFSKEPLVWLLGALIVWGALSSFWGGSDNPETQFKRALFPLFLIISFGYLGKLGVDSVHRVMLLSVVVAVMSACYILWAFYWRGGADLSARLVGVNNIVHPILLTFVYGFYALVALLQSLNTRRSSHALFWGVAAFVLCLCVLMTKSRGSSLALVVGCCAIFAGSSRRRVWPVLVIFSVAVVVYLSIFGAGFLSRGDSYRVELWFLGVNEAFSNIWVGAGVGSDFSLKLNMGAIHDHPHNMYIYILMELGVVGLVLFFSSLSVVFVRVVSSKNYVLFGGLGCFSCIAMIFDGGHLFARPREIWFLYWIPMALFLSYSLSYKFLEEGTTE